MASLLANRPRSLASTPLHKRHLIADDDLSALNTEAVQRQLAVEPSLNTTADFLIYNQRVTVV
jgi:hypothetical protein